MARKSTVAAAVPDDRPPLDRRRIVEEAVSFIEEDGLTALTMRKLGRRLGVEAMSLYRYLPGREDLLDAVVEQIVAEMVYPGPRPEGAAQGGRWRDDVRDMAHGVRRVALRYPRCFPLVASRPPAAPWLRPPLRSLRWVEAFLACLVGDGFTDEAAAGAYRACSSFLLGHLLLEVSGLGADVGPLDALEDPAVPRESLEDFPVVARLRPLLTHDDPQAEFDRALELLLDGLVAGPT